MEINDNPEIEYYFNIIFRQQKFELAARSLRTLETLLKHIEAALVHYNFTAFRRLLRNNFDAVYICPCALALDESPFKCLSAEVAGGLPEHLIDIYRVAFEEFFGSRILF